MENWIEVADKSTLADGQSLECTAGEKIIALFRVGEKFYAMDGICPHHGGPLGQGSLDGCVVSCPWHGWKFDVTDGSYQSSETMFHATYPVKIESGKVLVNIAKSHNN